MKSLKDEQLTSVKEIKKTLNRVKSVLDNSESNFYDYSLLEINLQRSLSRLQKLISYVELEISTYNNITKCKNCNTKYENGYCTNDSCLNSYRIRSLIGALNK